MTRHNDECTAPICSDDNNPNYKKDVMWYPGESVCGKSPMTKWQRNQRKINRKVAKGTFKHTDTFFTAETLERMSRVMDGTKGRNPDKL